MHIVCYNEQHPNKEPSQKYRLNLLYSKIQNS